MAAGRRRAPQPCARVGSYSGEVCTPLLKPPPPLHRPPATPPPPAHAAVHPAAGRTWADMSRVLLDFVGKFGWQDTKVPWLTYAGGAVLVVGLAVGALTFGRRRDRLILAASIAVGFAVILAVG